MTGPKTPGIAESNLLPVTDQTVENRLRGNMVKQTKNKPNPKVDFFFNKAEQWKQEFEKLRRIILDCGCQMPLEVVHP